MDSKKTDMAIAARRDEEITGYFPETVDEDHLISHEDCCVIPDETVARYRDQLHIDGSAIDRLPIRRGRQYDLCGGE